MSVSSSHFLIVPSALADPSSIKYRQPEMKTPSVAVNRRSWNLTACLIILTLWMPLFAACGSPEEVSAVPRTSKFSPVFGEEKPVAVPETPNHDFDLSFLNDDHFACVRINPASFLHDNDFAEIQWQDLESQIAKLLGEQNSRLDKMSAIWLVLDQSVVSAIGSANGDLNPPIVWIFDYASPYDANQLAQLESRQSQSKLSIKSLSKSRLAVGSEAALNKLADNSSNSELVQLVSRWDKQAAVQGALTIAPIRSFLVSIFEMVSRLGPETRKLASLPDVVDNVQLSITLEPATNGDQVLMKGLITISDEELAREIVKSISSFGENSSSTMPAIINGGLSGNESASLMFKPTSNAALAKLGQEIRDKRLFSAQHETGRIVFQLLRPASVGEAIAASVADGKKQLEIMARAEKLTRIAEAIKAYEAKYGCLPSMNAISPDESRNTGKPPQLSWQTALLPFLDQQALYNRFDFAKPWDARENLDIARDIPDVFKTDDTNELTSLQLVAGAAGVYRTDRSQPLVSDIKDKPIWTAIVIEAGNHAARNWIQPGIVPIDDGSSEELGQPDENGVLIITAAFKVRAVKKDNELLRKVLTSEGGETMSRTDFIPLQISDRN
jgi:hypothetical protein